MSLSHWCNNTFILIYECRQERHDITKLFNFSYSNCCPSDYSVPVEVLTKCQLTLSLHRNENNKTEKEITSRISGHTLLACKFVKNACEVCRQVTCFWYGVGTIKLRLLTVLYKKTYKKNKWTFLHHRRRKPRIFVKVKFSLECQHLLGRC